MITYKVSKTYQALWFLPGFTLALINIFAIRSDLNNDVDIFRADNLQITLIVITINIFILYGPISSAFHALQINSTSVTYKKQFVTRTIQTIEANKLEGVAIKQGPLGRIANYGKIEMTGTGGIKIKTIPFDDVYSVAEEIRNINPKLSDNQFKVAQDDRPNGGSTAGELEKLSQLLEKGLITREEFDSQKRKLLG
jgi:uncharacterized membrane protein YdbT with pleckstrin-like domain